MLEGILIGTLIAVAVLGGEAVLAALGTIPLIGNFATWYTGLIGPLEPGISANLIYGAVAAQVVILTLATLLYGPKVIRRGFALLRKPPVAH